MTATLSRPSGSRSIARLSPLLDLSCDPLGFAAGDANLSRYVGNDPLNFTDPSGLEKYRDRYIKATPDLPRDWQVHHTIQQAMRERFANLGIDVDDPKFLRGIPKSFHDEITKMQSKWWDDFAGIHYGGDIDEAYRRASLNDLARFLTDIDDAYGDLWVEAGDSDAIRDKIKSVKQAASKFNSLSTAGQEAVECSRMGQVMKKWGMIGIGAIGLVDLFTKAAAVGGTLDPNTEAGAAFSQIITHYRAILASPKVIGSNRWSQLQDAFMDYLNAIGTNDQVKQQTFRLFQIQGAKL